ncbi:piggyBac transposable element-derived protein 4-like isoform X1 [Periplaneta americana]|uniref:piggyBac transposable element-derived protein 4-like isoform X1 n=1 Tax=Periplaneta americana TaxID=6978 RepID=UPI0037E85F56
MIVTQVSEAILSDDSDDNQSSSSDVEDDGDDEMDNVDNDGWDLWGANDHDFHHVPFRGTAAPHTGQKPDSLFLEIATKTNRYIRQKIRKVTLLQKHSIWNWWEDDTTEELMAFHGVILNMGRRMKSTIKDFFLEQWLDSSRFYKDIFSRERFLQIYWSLHVSPPPRDGTSNRQMQSQASKVKHVIDYIESKFLEFYSPLEYVCVDESTVNFKGRVVFKMHNPQKPTKWGLRIYVIADSTNGYVRGLIPYYGSVTTKSLIHPELTFTSRIVLQLINKVQSVTNEKGYHLYTDRFYTNLDLARELLQANIHLTGTIIQTRKGLPKQMKRKALKIKKHEVVAYRKEDKYLTSWKDKRVVTVLNIWHNPVTSEVSRKTAKKVKVFQKPVAVLDYTSKMGGVDRADHYCLSYGFLKKSLKWWRKLYFWILEISLVNSFHLYNLNQQSKNLPTVSHLEFRKKIIVGLVGNVRNKISRKRGRPSTNDTEDHLNGTLHLIRAHERKVTKDCEVYSNRKVKGGRKETSFYCNTCERKPGLHPNKCFAIYHAEKKYR